MAEGTGSRRVTDEEGYFRFDRLPEGGYRIATERWAYEPRTAEFAATAGRLTQVEVATELMLPLRLTEGSVVRLGLAAEPLRLDTVRVAITESSLLWVRRRGADAPQAIPLAAIQSLEVRRLEPRPWAGAAGGSILGGIAGALLGPARETCFAGRRCSGPGEVMVGALAGGVVGAGVGWLTGELILRTARWTRLPLPTN